MCSKASHFRNLAPELLGLTRFVPDRVITDFGGEKGSAKMAFLINDLPPKVLLLVLVVLILGNEQKSGFFR